MMIRDITEKDRKEFNNIINHPLQSFEWGEFRKKTGVKMIRRGFFKNNKTVDGFQLTIHKIPKLPWTIGYLPKGNHPTKELIDELHRIGEMEKCIFIQLEPNVPVSTWEEPSSVTSQVTEWAPGRWADLGLRPSFHPLFTKFTLILDLTKSEDELLKGMHPKTRYNIKVAQKHGVEIMEDDSDEAFETYLKLTSETTKRQKFYAHTENYHRLMWETLKVQSSVFSSQLSDKSQSVNQSIGLGDRKTDKQTNQILKTENRKPITENLNAHLLTAKYNSKILAAWILFVFHDTLYYPYGASSSEYRNVMATNLMMWEGILFGKKLGLKKFDMWGSLGPNPNPKDPWFGFHKFKEGYGGRLTEFMGSYDLIINPHLYRLFKIADKMRWTILKLRK